MRSVTVAEQSIRMKLKEEDAKVYATYYTTRKDNEWAKANLDEVQQMYIMTDFYTAESDSLSIHLMDHLYPDMLQVNTRDDIERWWEVISGQPERSYLMEHGSMTLRAGMS